MKANYTMQTLSHDIRGSCVVISYVTFTFKKETKGEQEMLLDMLGRNLTTAQSSLDQLKGISLTDERNRILMKTDITTLVTLLTQVQNELLGQLPDTIQDQISHLKSSTESLKQNF